MIGQTPGGRTQGLRDAIRSIWFLFTQRSLLEVVVDLTVVVAFLARLSAGVLQKTRRSHDPRAGNKTAYRHVLAIRQLCRNLRQARSVLLLPIIAVDRVGETAGRRSERADSLWSEETLTLQP